MTRRQRRLRPALGRRAHQVALRSATPRHRCAETFRYPTTRLRSAGNKVEIFQRSAADLSARTLPRVPAIKGFPPHNRRPPCRMLLSDARVPRPRFPRVQDQHRRRRRRTLAMPLRARPQRRRTPRSKMGPMARRQAHRRSVGAEQARRAVCSGGRTASRQWRRPGR